MPDSVVAIGLASPRHRGRPWTSHRPTVRPGPTRTSPANAFKQVTATPQQPSPNVAPPIPELTSPNAGSGAAWNSAPMRLISRLDEGSGPEVDGLPGGLHLLSSRVRRGIAIVEGRRAGSAVSVSNGTLQGRGGYLLGSHLRGRRCCRTRRSRTADRFRSLGRRRHMRGRCRRLGYRRDVHVSSPILGVVALVIGISTAVLSLTTWVGRYMRPLRVSRLRNAQADRSL
jgi:hypothetical protein